MLFRFINPLQASLRVYRQSCLNGMRLRFHHFLWRLIGQIWHLLLQLLVLCNIPFQIALWLGGVRRQFSLRWLGFKGLRRHLLCSGPPWLPLIVLCFGHLVQSLFSISLLLYLFVSFVLPVIVPDLDCKVFGVLLSQFVNGVFHQVEWNFAPHLLSFLFGHESPQELLNLDRRMKVMDSKPPQEPPPCQLHPVISLNPDDMVNHIIPHP